MDFQKGYLKHHLPPSPHTWDRLRWRGRCDRIASYWDRDRATETKRWVLSALNPVYLRHTGGQDDQSALHEPWKSLSVCGRKNTLTCGASPPLCKSSPEKAAPGWLWISGWLVGSTGAPPSALKHPSSQPGSNAPGDNHARHGSRPQMLGN